MNIFYLGVLDSKNKTIFAFKFGYMIWVKYFCEFIELCLAIDQVGIFLSKSADKQQQWKIQVEWTQEEIIYRVVLRCI